MLPSCLVGASITPLMRSCAVASSVVHERAGHCSSGSPSPGYATCWHAGDLCRSWETFEGVGQVAGHGKGACSNEKSTIFCCIHGCQKSMTTGQLSDYVIRPSAKSRQTTGFDMHSSSKNPSFALCLLPILWRTCCRHSGSELASVDR